MDGFEATALKHDDSEFGFFAGITLFRDVPRQDIENILGMVKHERFEAGEIILLEGEATNDLLIVREGNVQVYVSRDEQKIPITQLGPTAYFGEMSVFDDYPRSANVAAVTDVVICRIDRDNFRSFLKANPAALFQMCTVFSHRLRNTNSALAKR